MSRIRQKFTGCDCTKIHSQYYHFQYDSSAVFERCTKIRKHDAKGWLLDFSNPQWDHRESNCTKNIISEQLNVIL